MHPDDAIKTASDLIITQNGDKGRFVLAIDGEVCAGKSHLAKGIREKLRNVSILRTDHFFCPPTDFRLQLDPEMA